MDGVNLALGLSAEQDKVIGEANNAPDIKEYDIRGLLVTGYINYPAS